LINLYKFAAAALMSCSIASGASAITMTVTQTGTLDFIEYENFDYFDNPPASHLAKIGDVGTVTYDIDLDQIGTAALANWGSVNWTSDAATNYVSGDALLTLGGVTHNMGAMTVQVGEFYQAGLSLPYRQWIDIYNADMYYYNFFPSTFSEQNTSLLDLVNRGEPVTDDILYLYLQVPVPAPFLMLGMAMLGLIGFGRRTKA